MSACGAYVDGVYQCTLPKGHGGDCRAEQEVPYDREVLVDVLVYHYRKDNASCGCGWAELGRSHAAHVATVYEESVAVRRG